MMISSFRKEHQMINIDLLQEEVNKTEYWDMLILDFQIKYFGDEVYIYIQNDELTSWEISFLKCFEVKYKTDVMWRGEYKVKNADPKTGYYGQDISLSQNEECSSLVNAKLDLSIIFVEISCKEIFVEKINNKDLSFFWNQSNDGIVILVFSAFGKKADWKIIDRFNNSTDKLKYKFSKKNLGNKINKAVGTLSDPFALAKGTAKSVNNTYEEKGEVYVFTFAVTGIAAILLIKKVAGVVTGKVVNVTTKRVIPSMKRNFGKAKRFFVKGGKKIKAM